MTVASCAKKIRSESRRSRSNGYEKCHGCTLLVKCAAAAGVQGLHVDRTVLFLVALPSCKCEKSEDVMCNPSNSESDVLMYM